jgi:hypothetical protein
MLRAGEFLVGSLVTTSWPRAISNDLFEKISVKAARPQRIDPSVKSDGCRKPRVSEKLSNPLVRAFLVIKHDLAREVAENMRVELDSDALFQVGLD